MWIYRLEHWSSGLGPFQHHSSRQKHPDQRVLEFLKTEAKNFMPDISEVPFVKEMLKKYPKAVFGWDDLEKCHEMIRNPGEVKKLGFEIRSYRTSPLFVGVCGQVLFIRPKN